MLSKLTGIGLGSAQGQRCDAPILGTPKKANLESNIGSVAVSLTKEDLIVEIEAAMPADEVVGERLLERLMELAWHHVVSSPLFIMEWLLEGILRHIQESMKSTEMKCQARILSVMQDRGTDLHNVSLQTELWKQVVLQEFV
ncbi:unnamed protein product [Sphagnum troendelagicum]|uniref:Uncharacterized protein n=1 Tax=Sphagnum troendelagicum TaxID=128251 RepID=A0ABP0TI36_9BRYO